MPNLMPFQELPFNGDWHILEEVRKLFKMFSLRSAIETGTCLGSTTLALSEIFDEVATVEVNEEWLEIAKKRFKAQQDKILAENDGVPDDNSTVTFIHGDSEKQMLSMCRKAKRDYGSAFIFLDAHWGSHCPLLGELSAIAESGIIPVIAIHDFKVPGHPELGFDKFPDGRDFEEEHIRPYLDKIYGKGGYHVYYNTTELSTEIKRGIVFIVPNKDALNRPIEAPVFGRQTFISVHRITSPSIRLIVNYYNEKNPDRKKELLEATRSNYENNRIDHILFLIEPDSELDFVANFNDLLAMVSFEVVDQRPTYRDYFHVANRAIINYGHHQDITIIANLDIFITETVCYYLEQHMRPGLCMALSPWDRLADGSYRQGKVNVGSTVEVPKDDAQDVWVFKGMIQKVENCDFALGKPGCDNSIAFWINQAGYTVVNPSNDIRPVHIHLSGVRNYDTTLTGHGENKDRIPPPYLTLPPISIDRIPPPSAIEQMSMAGKTWVEKIAALPDKGTYSQFNEDVIIQHIFKNIGTVNRLYVDLGAGAYNGKMSNTQLLRESGWIGFGVDAEAGDDTPHLIKEVITPENVVQIMKDRVKVSSEHQKESVIDFLNLDIDSCDFWVLANILKNFQPRVICTEFNGTLDPDVAVALEYEPGYMWDGTNKYGYSFAAGKALLEWYGYSIIYNQHNVNIFAVHNNELIGVDVPKISASKDMYHPVNPSAKFIPINPSHF